METSVLQSAVGRPLGRPRCRWEDTLKKILNEIGRRAVGFCD